MAAACRLQSLCYEYYICSAPSWWLPTVLESAIPLQLGITEGMTPVTRGHVYRGTAAAAKRDNEIVTNPNPKRHTVCDVVTYV